VRLVYLEPMNARACTGSDSLLVPKPRHWLFLVFRVMVCARERILIRAHFATMRLVMTMMAMMLGCPTALAAELVRYAARDVMFAVCAFLSFFEDLLVAEFSDNGTTLLVVFLLGLVFVLVMADGLVLVEQVLRVFLVLLVAKMMTCHY
jgi:hypothetical protein